MVSIFYDLETTTTVTVGQILNYCFTLVDAKFEPIEECAGTVRLSRLELPAAGAILSNRTDILHHQRTSSDTEVVAARRIHDFILAATRSRREQVPLIGYNSARFDLKWIRTVFVRNGLNPYFGGRLVYRDLLQGIRYLSWAEPDFPRPVEEGREEGDGPRVTLSLEPITRALGLLSGSQRHEARSDVHLTIALARVCRERFGHDCSAYQGYEALTLHDAGAGGAVFMQVRPEYDPAKQSRAHRSPITFLAADRRGALWIDLESYRGGAGRRSIVYVNTATGQLVCDAEPVRDPDLEALARTARAEFAGVAPDNFFARSTCDIECDIYRIDMSRIDDLSAAIGEGQRKRALKSPADDTWEVFRRHRLANYIRGSGAPSHEATFERSFREYAEYRYGGRMLISRPDEAARFHPTLAEMIDELRECYRKGTPEDRALLSALHEYYRTSEVAAALGVQLELPLDSGEG